MKVIILIIIVALLIYSASSRRIARSYSGMQKRGNKASNRVAAHKVSWEVLNNGILNQETGRPYGSRQKKQIINAMNNGKNLRIKSSEGNQRDRKLDRKIISALNGDGRLTNQQAVEREKQYSNLVDGNGKTIVR